MPIGTTRPGRSKRKVLVLTRLLSVVVVWPRLESFRCCAKPRERILETTQNTGLACLEMRRRKSELRVLSNHPFLWDKRVRQACAANGGGSPPPRHRNARCQLRQVTSAHAPWLEVERHQDDTLIGIARVDPKIRLTTLLNCSRAVRPGWDRPSQETARMCPTCTRCQRAIFCRGVIHLCAQPVCIPWRGTAIVRNDHGRRYRRFCWRRA